MNRNLIIKNSPKVNTDWIWIPSHSRHLRGDTTPDQIVSSLPPDFSTRKSRHPMLGSTLDERRHNPYHRISGEISIGADRQTAARQKARKKQDRC